MKRKRTGLETLNQAQAAHYVGLSRTAFETVVQTVPHRRAGSRVLIRRGALDRWLGERNGTGNAREDIARTEVAARSTLFGNKPARRREAGTSLRPKWAAPRGHS